MVWARRLGLVPEFGAGQDDAAGPLARAVRRENLRYWRLAGGAQRDRRPQGVNATRGFVGLWLLAALLGLALALQPGPSRSPMSRTTSSGPGC